MCIILEMLDCDMEEINLDLYPVTEDGNNEDLTANYSICVDDIE